MNLNEDQLNYYKASDRNKNITIIILSIVVVLLSVLCVYFTFFRKSDKVEKEEHAVEIPVDKFKEEIDMQIKNIAYTRIVNEKISHDKLFLETVLNSAIYNVEGTDIGEVDILSEEDEVVTIKKIATALGLTESEVEDIDIEIWKNIYGGSTGYTIYDRKDIENYIEETYKNYKYNLNLNSSKYIELSAGGMIYDKNIDKFIYHVSGTTFSPLIKPIIVLNKSFVDKVYKIVFIQTSFKFAEDDVEDDYCYVIDKDEEHKKIDCFSTFEEPVGSGETLEQMAKDYVLNHKSDLPQYEISFKLNSDKYEFIDIKKLN